MSCFSNLCKCCLPVLILIAPATSFSKENKEKLVIGIVSTRAQKHIKRTQPLADYLAQNLAGSGIKSVDIRISNNLEQMGIWLQSGKVDLVAESIFSALTLQNQYGGEIALLRWKNGVDSYSTLFFTHKDSEINNLKDLQGKIIAFENRHSTSAFYVPAAMLINSGYRLQKLASLNEPVSPDKIGYVFVEELLNISSEAVISSWVYRKQVAAGAFSDRDWHDPEVMPNPYKNRLRVFSTSSAIPRSVMLYRPDIKTELKQRITDTLTSAHYNKYGKSALYSFSNTSKFERFQLTQEKLQQIEELQNVVTNNLIH